MTRSGTPIRVTNRRCNVCARIPNDVETLALLATFRLFVTESAGPSDASLSSERDDIQFAKAILESGRLGGAWRADPPGPVRFQGSGALCKHEVALLQQLVGAKGSSGENNSQYRATTAPQQCCEESRRSVSGEMIEMSVCFILQQNDSAVVEAADAGCDLCRTLITTRRMTSMRDVQTADYECEVSICFTMEKGETQPTEIEFKFHQGGKGSDEARELWHSLVAEEVSDVTSLEGEASDQKLECLVKETILPWIKICDAGDGQHQHCRPGPLECNNSLPTRLIDVGTGLTDTVRLVVTNHELNHPSEDIKYLALSYCWGEGNDAAKTTTLNLEKRLDEISIQSLPRTIRDAIKLTRLMSIRYLWVDALCILQSDKPKENLEDFYSEAARIGSHYSNAYCLISALAASGSEEGLFANRHPELYHPHSSCAVGYDGKSKRQWLVDPDLEHPRVKRTFNDGSPAMKRGWCFQERLLSPRILHWSTAGLIWQCRGAEASETSPELRTMTKRSLLAAGDDRIVVEPRDRALGALWPKLIRRYQQMSLTYKDDRLAAVEGLGNKLAALHDDKYFAGVFLSHLAQGLLWRGTRRVAQGPDAAHFPTWSWGGAENVYLQISPVVSLIESPGEGLENSVFPLREGLIPMMGNRNRRLWLRAPLLCLETLIRRDEPYRSMIEMEKRHKLHYYFDFDTPETRGVPQKDVKSRQILLLGCEEDFRSLRGIAVRKSKGDPRYHERIGHVKVETKGFSMSEEDLMNVLEEWRMLVELI